MVHAKVYGKTAYMCVYGCMYIHLFISYSLFYVSSTGTSVHQDHYDLFAY